MIRAPVSCELWHVGGCINQIDSLPCKATAANHIPSGAQLRISQITSRPLSLLITNKCGSSGAALKVYGVASICFADCNGGICNMTGLQMVWGWLANIWTQHRLAAFGTHWPTILQTNKWSRNDYFSSKALLHVLSAHSNYHQVFVHCNLLRTHPSSYESQTSLMWWRAGIRNHDDQHRYWRCFGPRRVSLHQYLSC